MKRGIRVLLVLALCIVLVASLAACGGDDNTDNSASNSEPVANAGLDQTVTTGTEVILNGTGSTDDDTGDVLTYSWSFANVPAGSLVNSAALSNATVADPAFTTDLSGLYVVELIVNDGTDDSAPDTATIRALSLPDTGQTDCYDAAGNVLPDCAGTGQDGEYSINPMGFSNNSDGTVTDNVTHLMWQQEDDGIAKTWDDAVVFCNGLTLIYDDWRLPSKTELMSIADYGKTNPVIDTTVFPNTSSTTSYWTNTEDAATPLTDAWRVSFANGFVGSWFKTVTFPVRCVRGEQQAAQSFTDNGDGTVTDNGTGLMWQRCSAGQTDYDTCSGGTASPMSWEEALDYCNKLPLAGHAGWRLPNVKELVSITDDANLPAIDETYFPNTTGSYWSSTTSVGVASWAWCMDSSDGFSVLLSKTGSNNSVRCVR